MTKTCEKETISKLCDALSGISEATVTQAYDFSNERSPIMIVVAVDSVEKPHIGLDDYILNASILVDSLITEDLTASSLYKVKNDIDKVCADTEALFPTFTSVFGELPVVGFYQSADDEISSDGTSLMAKKHLKVIISY